MRVTPPTPIRIRIVPRMTPVPWKIRPNYALRMDGVFKRRRYTGNNENVIRNTDLSTRVTPPRDSPRCYNPTNRPNHRKGNSEGGKR